MLRRRKKRTTFRKIRLLYVAITRARDFLVLCGITDNGSFQLLNTKDSISFYLNETLEEVQSELIEEKYATIFKCEKKDNILKYNEEEKEQKEEFLILEENNFKKDFKKTIIASYSSLKEDVI